jgi:hypothetical protein
VERSEFQQKIFVHWDESGEISGLPEGTKAIRINGALSTLQPLKLLDFYTICRVGSRADTAPKRGRNVCNQRSNVLPNVGAF